MKLLFLSKRQYTGRDLIDDHYGRLYELPESLSKQGQIVEGYCLSYHKVEAGGEHTTPCGVRWYLSSLLPVPPLALWRYYRRLSRKIVADRPDVLVGSSDVYHAILTAHLAKKYKLPFVIDLYDQYEAFTAARVPGVRNLFRKAIIHADVVSCVSDRLKNWVVALKGGAGTTGNVGNAVSKKNFFCRPRDVCRSQLNLPDGEVLLIGTAGALSKSRRIDLLYKAFEALAKRYPNLHLVVAGPRDIPVPRHVRIHDLGILPPDQIPTLFSALDIGVVCNDDSQFSYYCCPQKLLEMEACGLRAVTADIIERPGVSSELQFRTGDVDSLIACVDGLLVAAHNKRANVGPVPTWDDQAKKLVKLMEEACGL